MDNIFEDIIKDIKDVINSIKQKENPVKFTTSGNTTLNFALSGKGKDGGWAKGRIVDESLKFVVDEYLNNNRYQYQLWII